MEVRNTKKYIWIFLLCCLPLSNILWYASYSSGDESVSTSLVILTSFLPALVAYSDSFYQAHIVPMNGAGNEKRAKGTVHKLWNR